MQSLKIAVYRKYWRLNALFINILQILKCWANCEVRSLWPLTSRRIRFVLVNGSFIWHRWHRFKANQEFPGFLVVSGRPCSYVVVEIHFVDSYLHIRDNLNSIYSIYKRFEIKIIRESILSHLILMWLHPYQYSRQLAHFSTNTSLSNWMWVQVRSSLWC